MRISKEMASRIAACALENRKNEINELEEKLSQEATSIVEREVPQIIIEAYKSYPDYIKSTKSTTLHGEGLPIDYGAIVLTKLLPGQNGYGNSSSFFIQPEEYKKINASRKNINKKREQLKDDKRTLEDVIFDLKTIKRVSENVPELIPFLPSENTALATIPNVDGIRKMLKA